MILFLIVYKESELIRYPSRLCVHKATEDSPDMSPDNLRDRDIYLVVKFLASFAYKLVDGIGINKLIVIIIIIYYLWFHPTLQML